MTLQDIITEVRQICQQTDPNNSQVSDATITGFANDCSIQLVASTGTLPKEEFTTTASATVTLDTDFIKMDFASISDGTTSFPLETIDFNTFVRRYPQWQNQPLGKPQLMVRMTDLTWKVWPSPDSTWSGKTITMVGSAVPTPMSSTTDTPPFSVVLHPCYPHYCAWKFYLLLNNPERAALEYATFDAMRKINIGPATNTRGSLLAFKVG